MDLSSTMDPRDEDLMHRWGIKYNRLGRSPEHDAGCSGIQFGELGVRTADYAVFRLEDLQRI